MLGMETEPKAEIRTHGRMVDATLLRAKGLRLRLAWLSQLSPWVDRK